MKNTIRVRKNRSTALSASQHKTTPTVHQRMAFMTLEDSIMASSALMNVLAEKSEDSGLKMLTSHTLHNLDSDLLEFSKALNLPAMEQVNSEVAS